MSSWHSYPKLYNVGHSAVKDIFQDEVLVEEKVDGSQFSFGKINGELKVRSKGVQIDPEHPEKMFTKAVNTAKELFPRLTEGYTYRGEYLQSPKHNALAYDRTPNQHIIIFDINTEEEQYLSYNDKVAEAFRLGLEVVPILYQGKVDRPEQLVELLEKVSVLGGQKIEGVVIKSYTKFGVDKKALMAKHVSEAFKEVHKHSWKEGNPTGKDFIALLAESYRTPARWNKAIQHLKERGQLTNTPKDIGLLMKEVQLDIREECTNEIKEKLFEYAWRNIGSSSVKGLAEYYKNILLESTFKNE